MAIQTIKQNKLEYLTAEGISVPHCFTTRLGGVSTGIYASKNLTVGDGETLENVRRNHCILAEALGFAPEKLVMARQIHSDIVRVVTDKDCNGHCHRDYPQGDGLVTNTPGVTLMIYTADCVPLLFHDPVTGAVGAAHAGWRGTVLNIGSRVVEAMVREYGAKPEDIRCAIGPNIGPCHFETDRDVPDALIAAYGPEVQTHIKERDGKFFPDLKAINAMALGRAGVKHIEISESCTFCESHRFWSYRLSRGKRGSQGAFIVCREVES